MRNLRNLKDENLRAWESKSLRIWNIRDLIDPKDLRDKRSEKWKIWWEHLELIWIGLDRIGSNWRLRAPDTLGKFQKISKKPRASGAHLELIRWDVSTFWTFSASACSLFYAILKNKKKKWWKKVENGVPLFETNLRFILLKKADISEIAFLKESPLVSWF